MAADTAGAFLPVCPSGQLRPLRARSCLSPAAVLLLLLLLQGDRHVVNCLEPHPHHILTLATSGGWVRCAALRCTGEAAALSRASPGQGSSVLALAVPGVRFAQHPAPRPCPTLRCSHNPSAPATLATECSMQRSTVARRSAREEGLEETLHPAHPHTPVPQASRTTSSCGRPPARSAVRRVPRRRV